MFLTKSSSFCVAICTFTSSRSSSKQSPWNAPTRNWPAAILALFQLAERALTAVFLGRRRFGFRRAFIFGRFVLLVLGRSLGFPLAGGRRITGGGRRRLIDRPWRLIHRVQR